ncbi:hypothetical protein PJ311_01595 [Bacillus sp. CLL-7-23]|uniref:Uncharacterized protein n=1 Tax=Bacillus changyiensis TaxID=3004103 RepID=A0ABT4WZE3_9BACI|nr:hypothetical protein [Bacillus changyiensis]MDA7025300.1 hypothetical protein [Bacillus changyiensis]
METGETKPTANKKQGFSFDHVKFSYDGSKTILDIEKLETPLIGRCIC